MGEILETLVAAPLGTLLTVTGAVLLLVAAGFKLYFEPDKFGRQFAAVAGVLLVAAGSWILIRDDDRDAATAVNVPTTVATETSTPSIAPTASATGTATPAAVCRVSGTVFNYDNNQPLAGIELFYERITVDPTDALHQSRARLAQTAPNGRFSFDCSGIERENLPSTILFRHPAWRLPAPSRMAIGLGVDLAEQNLWVSDSAMRALPMPTGDKRQLNVPLMTLSRTRPTATATARITVDPALLQASGTRGVELTPNQ